jgi:hypothetical protein
MREVPFEPVHLERMTLQREQAGAVATILEAGAAKLGEMGFATSLLTKDDTPIFCGGWIGVYPGRCISWSVISAEIGQSRLISAFRLAKRRLAECEFGRIETTVSVGHLAAHRWCQMLGYKPEGRMRKYDPDGSDAVMYALIRENRNGH